ncbi:hypothetical protein [Pedosphaera parvula]|uniref:Uncharacterized protein n=1 Tax=Pedosphaera parvula (strain Ellin514) TaxID=320771 RepID=B9XQM2_PEDPL|nr:hypothetical protein [Pedosphaera parvula]EEF57872.1 hypothetical protein Cflav_PD0936 [Pedosphaera parvula Ellin514]
MKKLVVVLCAILGVTVVFLTRKPSSSNAVTEVPIPLTTTQATSSPKQTVQKPSASTRDSKAVGSVAPGASQQFAAWLAVFDARSATPEKIAIGQKLAEARREEMKQLMRDNPREALAQSVSLHQWEALPQSIREQVEKPFSEIADYDVLSDCRSTDEKRESTMATQFVRGEGKVNVFGLFEGVPSKTGLPVQGISLDGEVVLRNEVLQVLDDADAAAARKMFAEGNPADESLVTGKKISGGKITILWGGKVFTFASTEELNEVESAMEQARAQVGPNTMQAVMGVYATAAWGGTGQSSGNPTTIKPLSFNPAWSATPKKVLVVRVDYTPPASNPYTLTMLTNLYASASNCYLEMSYSNTWLIPTYATQVVQLPHPGELLFYEQHLHCQ